MAVGWLITYDLLINDFHLYITHTVATPYVCAKTERGQNSNNAQRTHIDEEPYNIFINLVSTKLQNIVKNHGGFLFLPSSCVSMLRTRRKLRSLLTPGTCWVRLVNYIC